MIALIARYFGLLRNTARADWDDSVAHSLMETAEARGGLASHEANELRQAAFAYLRVVR